MVKEKVTGYGGIKLGKMMGDDDIGKTPKAARMGYSPWSDPPLFMRVWSPRKATTLLSESLSLNTKKYKSRLQIEISESLFGGEAKYLGADAIGGVFGYGVSYMISIFHPYAR